MNRVTPLTRADDESARSPTGPLPRVLPPVVLLIAYPQTGGHAAVKPGQLNVRLAIEAAMADSSTRATTGGSQ